MAQNPIVTFEMADGKVFKAELYPDVAPNTVNNFLSLVKKGFYDGIIFHRVIAGFMIQGGDPKGLGTGGPGYHIKGEFLLNGVKNTLKHTRGVLSMARAQHPDSAGSQFFVMHADASHYRHQFTVDGVDYDLSQNKDDEAMAAYAKWIVNQVLEPGLDGVDVDWEGWSGSDLVRLIKELGKYFGPEGEQPDKLLIVDYFSGTPPTDIIPYCDYIVQQAYSDQVGFLTQPSNFPPEKMIYCESFGVFYADGGQLMNYARWEPSKGRKGGCGVFYLGRNYYSSSGIPYNEFREAIQIMNPAVNE